MGVGPRYALAAAWCSFLPLQLRGGDSQELRLLKNEGLIALTRKPSSPAKAVAEDGGGLERMAWTGEDEYQLCPETKFTAWGCNL